MFHKRKAPLLVTVIVLIVVAASVAWRTVYTVSDPSTEDFRVYAAFMSRLSADHGWGARDVVLAKGNG
jgi:multidrug resistance efflux pump